jgi:exodeoxyribonuclease VII small subunit
MSKPKSPEKMSYEQAFEELETIVQQLEGGELPLEKALSLFERGQALALRCSTLLEQAELKLKQLVPDEAQGYVEVDFIPEDE